ncbi:MAG: hypothetical protein AB7K63_01835 [Vicinamibacterales bacterium]
MRIATAAVAVFVFVFSFLLRYNDPSGSFAGLTDDHFFYLVRGWQILFGDLPVRDFVDHGAPGYFYVSAAVQAVIGRGTWSELLFSTVVLSLGASLTFWIAARASGSMLFGLLGAAFHVFLEPRYYNYPKIIVYAVAIPVLWGFANRPGTRRALAVAAVTAAGFMLRHDHGVFVAIGMATLLIGLRGVTWSARLRHAVVYGALVVALLSPYLVFIQLNGGLVPYFRSASAWAERDRGRAEVVWPGPLDNPEGVSEAATQGPWLQRARATYHDNRVAWLYYTMLALPAVAAAALAASRDAFRPGWPHAGAKVAVVIVLGLVLNAGFFRHPLEARLADPSVPHAVLIAWLGAGLVRAWVRREALRAPLQRYRWAAPACLAAITLPIMLIVAALLSDDTYRRLDKSSMAERPRNAFERVAQITEVMRASWPVNLAQRPDEESMRLAAYVRECTLPEDRVFFTPYMPQVLSLAGRAFAGGHADLRSGFFETAEEQQTTIARLSRQSVPMVFFDAGELPSFRESFPLIVRYLDERFVAAGERTLSDRRTMVLLVDRNRTPVRTHEALDWPCFR